MGFSRTEPRALTAGSGTPRRCISTGDVHSVVYPGVYRVVYTGWVYQGAYREVYSLLFSLFLRLFPVYSLLFPVSLISQVIPCYSLLFLFLHFILSLFPVIPCFTVFYRRLFPVYSCYSRFIPVYSLLNLSETQVNPY